MQTWSVWLRQRLMQTARLSAGRILYEPASVSMPQRMVYWVPAGSVYMVPFAPGQRDVEAAAWLDVDEAIICVDEGFEVIISGAEDDMSMIELLLAIDVGIEVLDIMVLLELGSSQIPYSGSQFSAAQ